MKENVFYTYLDSAEDDEGFFLKLYYKIDLPDGDFSESWVQNIIPVTGEKATYRVNVHDGLGDEKVHAFQLRTDNTGPNKIWLEGMIKIYGIAVHPRKPWYKESIQLSVKDGGTTGNGSTKHMGDADG